MAAITSATISRRAARAAIREEFRQAGVVITDDQARTIWRTGITVVEYKALQHALGIDTAHHVRKSVARKQQPRRSVQFRTPKVFASRNSDDYRSHIVEPGAGRDSAWVATDGTFFSVSYAGHSEFASKCAAAGVVRSRDSWGSYVGSLENKGWVHISGYVVVNEGVRDTLTAEQASALIAWAKTSSRAEAAVRRIM